MSNWTLEQQDTATIKAAEIDNKGEITGVVAVGQPCSHHEDLLLLYSRTSSSTLIYPVITGVPYISVIWDMKDKMAPFSNTFVQEL